MSTFLLFICSFLYGPNSHYKQKGPPGVTGELVTPTGVSLLKALTTKTNKIGSKQGGGSKHIAGRPPNFTIRKIGIGCGSKDFIKHPNILRLMLGDSL